MSLTKADFDRPAVFLPSSLPPFLPLLPFPLHLVLPASHSSFFSHLPSPSLFLFQRLEVFQTVVLFLKLEERNMILSEILVLALKM